MSCCDDAGSVSTITLIVPIMTIEKVRLRSENYFQVRKCFEYVLLKRRPLN